MNSFTLLFTNASVAETLARVPPIGDSILFHLLFGWVGYLARVVPQVSVRWDGIGYFVGAIVLLGLTIHRIASWLRREMSAQQHRWKWRSTGMVLGIVIVMFVAGIAMIGITHQSYWLVSDDRDLMVPTLPGHGRQSEYNLRMIIPAVNQSQQIHRWGGDDNQPKHSWITYALPYATYTSAIDKNLPWDHPDNQSETQKLIPVLLNPGLKPAVLRDEDGFGVTHYAGNSDAFDEDERLPHKFDKSSKLLLIGEVNADFPPWAKPGTNRDPGLGINQSPDGFGGPWSSGGANFAMADGSVQFFSDDTDPEVLRALGRPTE